MSALAYEYPARAGHGLGFCEGERAYRAHEGVFQRKYRHWRGRSGRTYAFSVYPPQDCPAYENAVVVVTRRRGGEALACVDLGALPEASLHKLRRRFEGDGVEFHIHVLAERAGERLSLIDDLAC